MMSNPDYVDWFDANEDSAAMREEVEADDMLNAVVMELLSSSEEEEEEDEDENKWGGSRKGRSLNKERDFAEAYAGLVKDYFNGSASVTMRVILRGDSVCQGLFLTRFKTL